MARSPRRRRRSAAGSSTRPTTSTRRSSSPRASRRRAWAARSRCGRWCSADRADLPGPVGPGAALADRLPRRLRPRRGGRPGGVRDRRPALAGRQHAVQPVRLAGEHRSQPRGRPHPPRAHARGEDEAARAPGGRGGGHGRDDLPRRAPRAHLHLLPSGALDRGAGRADVARPRRSDDRGDRARLPRAGGDDGAAARARAALTELMPDEPEVAGLLAVMLLQHSRRDARFRDGEIVLLADQDRALWDRRSLEAGRAALDRALALRGRGPYVLQAAIAALHTEDEIDWAQIAALTGELARMTRSPVVELNRAVAVAEADGLEAGLAAMDALDGLDAYHYFHAARADVLRRLGRSDEARAAYERALELVRSEAERRFLERRVAELPAPR